VFWTSGTGIDGHTPVDLDELDLICVDPLPSYIWYQEDMSSHTASVAFEKNAGPEPSSRSYQVSARW
jgi:hypothetical protein